MRGEGEGIITGRGQPKRRDQDHAVIVIEETGKEIEEGATATIQVEVQVMKEDIGNTKRTRSIRKKRRDLRDPSKRKSKERCKLDLLKRECLLLFINRT